MAKLKLILGTKERIVDSIEIRVVEGCPGISLVNGGHDDLFDLGFRVEDFKEHTLQIVPVEEPHATAQRMVPVVEMPGQSMVEPGQMQELRSADQSNSPA